MDQGLYILGGIALLVVVLLAYLVYAIASYRAAVRRANHVAEHDDQQDAEARYLAEDSGDLFAAPREGAAVPRGPVVSGGSSATTQVGSREADVAPFRIPEVHRPVPEHVSPTRAPMTPRGHAEVSTEVEGPATRQATAPPAPGSSGIVEPSPVAAEGPVSSAAPMASTAVDAAELPALHTPPRAPETPAVAPPAPAPNPSPAALSPRMPATETASQPAVAAMPGYSLGDELERLMLAAEEQQPLMPSGQQGATVPAESLSDPVPSFEAPPLMPPPSIGQALSSPAPAPEPAPAAAPEPTPEPAPAAAPISVSAPETSVAEPSVVEAPSVPEYSLVAPVELHFTAGPGRVGVKPGTRSHAEFQRLAAILLGDLHATRDH